MPWCPENIGLTGRSAPAGPCDPQDDLGDCCASAGECVVLELGAGGEHVLHGRDLGLLTGDDGVRKVGHLGSLGER